MTSSAEPGREPVPPARTPPLVSVVMNCYNGEAYLKEAIDSVFAQTYPGWEIVFWDNASTDGSARIAGAYGPRLRYFRSKRTTPLGEARSRALGEVRGELIAFLDCDDVWLPHKLERQVAAMEEDYALCYAGVDEIDAQGRPLRTLLPLHETGDQFEAQLKQFDINVPTAVLRKSVLDRRGLNFDPRVTASEEYCLFMQMAVGSRFCVVKEVLARYRVHDKALTNTSIAKWAEERTYTLDLLRRAHPGIEREHPAAFREAYARARYYRARYHVSRGERRRALGEMLPIAFVDARYLCLFFLLLLFPSSVWNYVHDRRTHRSRFS